MSTDGYGGMHGRENVDGWRRTVRIGTEKSTAGGGEEIRKCAENGEMLNK